MTAIKLEKDQDNIVTLTIDMPNQSANTMNAVYRTAMSEAVAELVAMKDDIAGVIVTSAKSTFFAGGDLNELVQATPEQADEFFQLVELLKAQLRQIETLGVPVVAAINGAALGGGFEIALACHHRVCLDKSKIKLGLPEVTLGLLPGGGGVARMVRLLGLEKAFPFLLEGKQLNPASALKAGIIDELASDLDELQLKARSWIQANPGYKAPWDQKGHRIPGGTPSHPKVAQMLAIAPAMLRNKTRGCYPAPEAIMKAAVEGAQVDFDNACRIESRYFTELTCGQVSKNMIGAFWFQLNEIKAGGSRPQGIEKSKTEKVGVLGAGMMGAGIAYSCATRGIPVVLKDVTAENAEKGKAYTEKLLQKKVSKGRLSSEKMQATLDLITATANPADLNGCDLIIEAVFENRELKAQVTQEAEGELSADGIFASNTSTLPITGLAAASRNAQKFIGLHFFSPVDKMPLVEIIKGEQTSPETLAKAYDFVLQIAKTPIVVNDSRGFFTSRTFATYVNEGVAMLSEGNHPSTIENGALQSGMPVGPLAVLDEVSLGLLRKITGQARLDAETAGQTYTPAASEELVIDMLDTHQRAGKAAGAGFYEYPKAGKKHLWPELQNHYVKANQQIPYQDVKDRLLFIQALETARCYEEGVLESVRDANIGSIFGLGFAPWSGGSLQYINQYGVKAFAERAKELSAAYGERFEPPKLLLDMAETGKIFSDD